MIKFYCQKARPIYVRTDDIWMTPSSKTAAGYVYVFTPDGYKDLVVNNLYQRISEAGFNGTEDEMIQNLVSEASAPDNATFIPTKDPGVTIQNSLDNLSSNLEDLSGEVAINSTYIQELKTLTDEQGDKLDSLDEEMDTKQNKLVSGTNIKTINNASLLGSGNIAISTFTPVTTPTSLAADATLKQVVAAYNNLLTKLQTAGILVDNGSSNN
jgi:hypothetical protein